MVFNPLTCIELRKARTDGNMIMLDMSLSANVCGKARSRSLSATSAGTPALLTRLCYGPHPESRLGSSALRQLLSPTIEKVIAKLKASSLNLLDLFMLDFQANGVQKSDTILDVLHGCRRRLSDHPGTWFNDAANFKVSVVAC